MIEKSILIGVLLAVMTFTAAGCGNPRQVPESQMETKADMTVNLTMHNRTFRVVLEDNETARAFRNLLPLELNMDDVNGNEKYTVLSETIQNDSPKNPGTIYAGDLMCYGNAGLVMFYETFASSYSYVKIGHIDDVNGYLSALESGSVQVSIAEADD